MAIWDDIGKKAERSAKELGNKAREIAEVARLNGQMAVKRTECEKLYVEIGKMYCSVRNGTDEDEKLSALCEDVKEIQTDMEHLQKMLDRLHNVRRCSVCGEVSSIDSRFCGSCGNKFEDEVKRSEAEAEDDAGDVIIVPETIAIDVDAGKPSERAEEAEVEEQAADTEEEQHKPDEE